MLLMLFTLLLFTLFVKLGYWQLSRAEEKRQLLSALEQRQAETLTMDSLLAALPGQVEGQRLVVTGELLNQPTLLLDNQVVNGRVGYLAFRLLQVPGYQSLLPVELGFVAAGNDRRQLPQLEQVTGQLSLQGRLYRKQSNPLSPQLNAEPGEPLRMQSLDIPALATLLGQPLLNIVLQPEQLPGMELPRHWTPVNMPPEKHLGYALQWFSLAATLALLMLFYLAKTSRTLWPAKK